MKNNDLITLSPKEILKKYNFSDRFYRLYAINIAKALIAKADNPDPRSIKAVEVAEAYLNGKATDKELAEAKDNAAASAYAASAYAASAACSIYNDSAYNTAANAAVWSVSKPVLLKMINELPELEKLLMGIEI